MYEYPAELVRCTDADTVRLIVDVGFNMTRREAAYRLLRVNAPELNTPEGKASKAALEAYLLGKKLTAQTFKSDAFGRYLVELTANGESVSDWLVSSGWAVYKTY